MDLGRQNGIYISYHALVIGLILALWSGYKFAAYFIGDTSHWQEYVQSDRLKLKELESRTQQHLRVLTQHVGRIEANLMRINALGDRLVEYAHLDPQEFVFKTEQDKSSTLTIENDTLLSTIKAFDAVLERRYVQMTALHQALQVRVGQHELSFSGVGKLVRNGWISSFFGTRHDPFTGRKSWHGGVDIVGQEGAEIQALASGIVSYAAEKGAYGQLIEINHGNGLATRYGHNKELLVTSGQLVKKGQAIALLGSTGRSTGPHLHLEVHKDGEAVDPGLYFPDLRKQG